MKYIKKKLSDTFDILSEFICCKLIIEPILNGGYPLRYRILDWIKRKIEVIK